jgi:hypothetical protein
MFRKLGRYSDNLARWVKGSWDEFLFKEQLNEPLMEAEKAKRIRTDDGATGTPITASVEPRSETRTRQ